MGLCISVSLRVRLSGCSVFAWQVRGPTNRYICNFLSVPFHQSALRERGVGLAEWSRTCLPTARSQGLCWTVVSIILYLIAILASSLLSTDLSDLRRKQFIRINQIHSMFHLFPAEDLYCAPKHHHELMLTSFRHELGKVFMNTEYLGQVFEY